MDREAIVKQAYEVMGWEQARGDVSAARVESLIVMAYVQGRDAGKLAWGSELFQRLVVALAPDRSGTVAISDAEQLHVLLAERAHLEDIEDA